MHVGVVVPAYAVEPFLDRTLASVHRQTHSNWACVVVDDGSPDQGVLVADRWVRRDSRFRLLTQDNGGVSRARNAGAALLADADALLFLDGDDVLADDALEVLSAGLAAAPGAVGAVGAVRIIDADDRVLGRTSLAAERLDLSAVSESNPCPTPSGFLYRRDAFERVGGYDPAFPFAQDWLLTLLIARQGHLIGLPNVVAGYRRRPGSVTATDGYRAGHAELRRIRYAVYADRSTTAANRRDLRRAWRRHHRTKAAEAFRARKPQRAIGHAGLVLLGRPLNPALLSVHRLSPLSGSTVRRG